MTGAGRTNVPLTAGLFSRDGRHLVTGNQDGAVLAWKLDQAANLKDAYEPVRLGVHGGPINSLAFSGDGRFLISAATDGARLWDWATGAPIRFIPTTNTGAPSPQPRAETAEPPSQPRSDAVERGSIPTRQSNQPMVQNNQMRVVIERSRSPEDGTTGALFAPNSSKFLTIEGSGIATIYDVAAPAWMFRLDGHVEGRAATFSADSRRLFTGSHRDFGIFVWNVETREQAPKIEIRGAVQHMIYLKTNDRLIAIDESSYIYVIDPNTGQVERRIDALGEISGAHVTPDEKRLILSDSGEIRIYDVNSGVRLLSHRRRAPMAYMEGNPVPDGAIAFGASRDGRFVLNSSRNLALLYEIPETTQKLIDAACRRLATRLDGTWERDLQKNAGQRPCIDGRKANR